MRFSWLLATAATVLAHRAPRSAVVTHRAPRSAVVALENAASALSATYDVASLARIIFDEQGLDAAAVRPLLARDCLWEDYTTRIASGADDVAEMIAAKPAAARPYTIERIANGRRRGGFTYHREDSSGTRGLRGTVFIELNDAGEIQFVREMAEPLFKPGEAMIKFLQARVRVGVRVS